MSYHADDRPHAACPWTNCQCSHVGCTDGWINDLNVDHARPCPTCRPEVARHLNNRHKSLRTLRRELPNLARPSRGPAYLHTDEETR